MENENFVFDKMISCDVGPVAETYGPSSQCLNHEQSSNQCDKETRIPYLSNIFPHAVESSIPSNDCNDSSSTGQQQLRYRTGHKFNFKTIRGICHSLGSYSDPPPMLNMITSSPVIAALFMCEARITPGPFTSSHK